MLIAEEKAILIETIRDAFPLSEAPRPLFRIGAPRDDFHAEIAEAVGSKRWSDLSISDWRGTGLHINVMRVYITVHALSYFVPGLMLSGIENDDLEYAMAALLPANQRWEPGGSEWDTFIGILNVKQRAAIQAFLAYVVQTEREEDALRAGAEYALWHKFYE